MQRNDRAMGLFWILFGLTIAGWSAATFPFGDMANPGPGYLPLACGILLAILGVALLFVRNNEEEAGGHRAALFPRGAAARRVAFTVGSMVLCAGLMEYIGFVPAAFLMTLVLMRAVDPVRWQMALVYAFVYSVGSFILFQLLLKTPLPVGMLWQSLS